MKSKSLSMAIILAFLCQISLSTAAGPIIAGKEWLQPAAVIGFSWIDFNAICPMRLCAGSVGVTDITGYRWATVDDVNELFNGYIGTTELVGPDSFTESESTWAPELLAEFRSTEWGLGQYEAVRGWTSDTTRIPIRGYIATIADHVVVNGVDFAGTKATDSIGRASLAHGAWLYRAAPASVPNPATITLFGLALAGLGISRRKRSRNR